MRAVVLLLGIAVAGLVALRLDVKSQVRMAPVAAQNAWAAYGRLPLIFEVNQGQTDSAVQYVAHGNGYGLFLTNNEAVLALHGSVSSEKSVLRMGLVGGRQAEITAADALPGKSNYFIGNDPTKWHSNVPQFARVRYQEVYPGVNLVYYGRQGQLEYDFEVAPGADPRQIGLKFDGASDRKLLPNGDLEISVGEASLRLVAPRVYQKIGSQQREVAGRFELRGESVGFVLGGYDRSRELIIDPVLTYSTYLGGSGAESCSAITGLLQTPGCPGVAVDDGGNAYVAGSTESTNFPVTASPLQGTLAGAADVFISKFNPAGTALVFSTYLGGTAVDYPSGISVDTAGNVYLAGTTFSTDFPTNGQIAAFQGSLVSQNGKQHAFVSKIAAAGAPLTYSTYLSGNGTDIATGIAIDTVGRVYVTGTTSSTEVETGFPSTDGAYQTSNATSGLAQFFFTKLDTTIAGTGGVLYSTYFGGSQPSTGTVVGGGIAVDTSGNAYISGTTTYTNMPTLLALQGSLNGPSDAFIFKINPTVVSGSQLVYGSYFGGSGDDAAFGIAVDSSNNAYLTGFTTSTDITTVSGTTPYQGTIGGGKDAFVAKFGVPCTGTGCSNTGLPLSYFTYLGGAQDDVGTAIVVDSIQGARITGWTASTDLPVTTTNAFQKTNAGGQDAFIARIDTSSTGNYVTYFGGPGNDLGTSIAVDTVGATYVAGETTSSSGFPLLTPFQGAFGGVSDAFASKFSPALSSTLTVSGTATPTPVGVGNQVSFVYTITNGTTANPGDFVAGVTFTDILPITGNATFTSATASPGSCGSANGGTVLCNIGALNSDAIATVTVILVPTISGNLGNTGVVGVTGTNFSASPSPPPSVVVNDFTLTASPSSVTVPAGVPASYNAVLTPTGNIPDSVSLSCSAGLPTGATCSVTTNPIPNLSNGPASTTLVINTTARITATTKLWQRGGPFYAMLLPIAGITLLGAGRKRRKKVFFGIMLGLVLLLAAFLPACGSKKSTTTTTGTPAGSYTVTVSATSGSIARTTAVQLVVQ